MKSVDFFSIHISWIRGILFEKRKEEICFKALKVSVVIACIHIIAKKSLSFYIFTLNKKLMFCRYKYIKEKKKRKSVMMWKAWSMVNVHSLITINLTWTFTKFYFNKKFKIQYSKILLFTLINQAMAESYWIQHKSTNIKTKYVTFSKLSITLLSLLKDGKEYLIFNCLMFKYFRFKTHYHLDFKIIIYLILYM